MNSGLFPVIVLVLSLLGLIAVLAGGRKLERRSAALYAIAFMLTSVSGGLGIWAQKLEGEGPVQVSNRTRLTKIRYTLGGIGAGMCVTLLAFGKRKPQQGEPGSSSSSLTAKNAEGAEKASSH